MTKTLATELNDFFIKLGVTPDKAKLYSDQAINEILDQSFGKLFNSQELEKINGYLAKLDYPAITKEIELKGADKFLVLVNENTTAILKELFEYVLKNSDDSVRKELEAEFTQLSNLPVLQSLANTEHKDSTEVLNSLIGQQNNPSK